MRYLIQKRDWYELSGLNSQSLKNSRRNEIIFFVRKITRRFPDVKIVRISQWGAVTDIPPIEISHIQAVFDCLILKNIIPII